MNIKQQIQSLLQEAELYRSQGLLAEAKGKYKDVVGVIQKNDQIKNRQNLIDGINKKIKVVESKLDAFLNAPMTVEVPEHVQDLIKKQFAFAHDQDEDTVALGGALALAKFGQYDRAMKEFNELLGKDAVRVEAAKNIIRCHATLESIEDAIVDYEKWFKNNIFNAVQSNNIRVFLETLLEKKGVEHNLSRIEESTAVTTESLLGVDATEEEDEEFIDISALTITFEDGPRKGETIEFDVNFQSHNVISLLFSRTEKKLVESFTIGLKLNQVQFISPIAIFAGSGIVTEKTEISSGPRQGDFSLDIKIQSAG